MIIVLTLGRSGSSMLMQVLQKLGVTVIGQKFDVKGDPLSQQIHEKLNPKGYFEKPEIFYGGPSSDEFQTMIRTGRSDIACKMDARHFVDEKQLPYWINAAEHISSILLSYRTPSEQARSEFLSGTDPVHHNSGTFEFTFLTRFLKDYVETYGAVEPLLSSKLQALAPKLDYVDYSEAKNPDHYIMRISEILNLQPSAEQLASAISNISPELFRVNEFELRAEERNWAVQSGAENVYSQIENSKALKMASFC